MEIPPLKPWLKPLSSLILILLIRRLQFTIAQLLIILTPRTSLLRPASIPLQLSLGAFAFPHVQHLIVPPISIHYRVLAGGTVALQTILSISVSSLIRLDEHDVSALTPTPSLSGKLAALTSLMQNQRCIGTPQEIKWIPPFDEHRPGYIPSRSEALRSTGGRFVAGYVARQLMITLLWQRIHLGLFWCLYIASWLNGIYLFGDLLGLLSGDSVRDHPPAFGSLRYTSTVRGFWGKYWHQSNRYPFQGAGNYVCKDLLGLRGRVQRYVNILGVFALSGVFHVVTDRAEGIGWEESRAMRFFCAQAGGILVEDGVQELWRRWVRKRRGGAGDGGDGDVDVPVWAKAVGYVWTWTFLSVTAGWFAQPHEHLFLRKHGEPFGVVKRILSLLRLDAVSAYLPEV
ncbi:MAG: hypothetical protein HETSPECPRED_009237 [Heterodermia speciosa]|uniref:Wax synthase domain-containing protein n=1 Tax=Heterodermia speciosa TaxID=116794 RepID=A0A8H3G469_9LECA|nr:MAG: hypothetical protein HETSPECPRED_009237 [Heterodermia speciosa]